MAVDQQTSRDPISDLTVPHQQRAVLLTRNLQPQKNSGLVLLFWTNFMVSYDLHYFSQAN